MMKSGNSSDGSPDRRLGGTDSQGRNMRIVTVAKVRGGEWFDRMEHGIREFALDTGVDSSMTGADDISAAKQVRIIEDLIAQRPTAITVVPNSPESLEIVLKRAREAGIIVVTHEASTQRNTDIDIEAFDNAAYGAHMMDNLATFMNGRGTYVAFVGHAKAQSHVEWIQGASERAKVYPGIQRIGDAIESYEDASVAYEQTKRLLATFPDIKGFMGTGSTDAAGIGRAVQEAGLQRQTSVVGTSIPSMVNEYLSDGSVDRIFFWDPSLAGRAQHRIALMLASGEPIEPGVSLHIPGYENLQPILGTPHAFRGDAWVDVDKTNASQYPF